MTVVTAGRWAELSVGERHARVTEIGPIMRHLYASAVRDKTYQHTPIGREIAKYLAAKRWEGTGDGHNTGESYETVLAKLAIDHADYHGLHEFATPVGPEYLREFLDRHWGHASPNTRRHRTSVLKSLFKWATENAITPFDPSAALKRPRAKNSDRQAHTAELLWRLATDQPDHRDTCALLLLWPLGLRKNELRLTTIRDIDLARNAIRVHGKGDREKLLPIEFAAVRRELYLHVVAGRRPDEYLLYPKQSPLRPLSPSGMHRWFKRCVSRAGLPDTIEMHELRHSAADHLWRATGNIVLAQMLLRHESVGTTQAYLHPSHEDLRAGMRLLEQTWGSLQR